MAALPLDQRYSKQVMGVSHRVTVQKTRATGTTQYTAGDQIDVATTGTGLTFTGIVPQVGPVDNRTGVATDLKPLLTGVQIVDSAYVATTLSCELWLFKTVPTQVADNAAIAFSDADLQSGNLLGIVPVSTAYVGLATSGAGGNCVLRSAQVAIPLECAAGTTTVYGVLVARNAYVPVDSEKFDVTLEILL